ncbi:EEF1A lysine methyltransferase 3-like [Chiloscyllium plagiosum]|uniref:EEF1A lysine methyltransferase 3-like n=1 Tax=Chiloscyllium plagiosum TaxID=36176 RepID=UPI001CB88353|nr:EEF1A lysine methyltransferase 3-like [Chiloscyllium plagiosum]
MQSSEPSRNDAPYDESYSPSCYITHNNFEFCGYNLKIAQILGANLGVSAYVWDARVNISRQSPDPGGSAWDIFRAYAFEYEQFRFHALSSSGVASTRGLALCRYFEKKNINFSGKKVIELGSGTGIVGILATLLGGDVTITDKPEVLKQIETNAQVNVPSACRHRLQIRPLTWGEDHTNFPADYDFVLGSDIVYSSVTYPALMETFRYFTSQGATIYLSSELRKRNGSPSFHDESLPQYFNCQIVDRLENKHIILYKMTKIDKSSEHDLPSNDRNLLLTEPDIGAQPTSLSLSN